MFFKLNVDFQYTYTRIFIIKNAIFYGTLFRLHFICNHVDTV